MRSGGVAPLPPARRRARATGRGALVEFVGAAGWRADRASVGLAGGADGGSDRGEIAGAVEGGAAGVAGGLVVGFVTGLADWLARGFKGGLLPRGFAASIGTTQAMSTYTVLIAPPIEPRSMTSCSSTGSASRALSRRRKYENRSSVKIHYPVNQSWQSCCELRARHCDYAIAKQSSLFEASLADFAACGAAPVNLAGLARWS